jgi:hypothetical protein
VRLGCERPLRFSVDNAVASNTDIAARMTAIMPRATPLSAPLVKPQSVIEANSDIQAAVSGHFRDRDARQRFRSNQIPSAAKISAAPRIKITSLTRDNASCESSH